MYSKYRCSPVIDVLELSMCSSYRESNIHARVIRVLLYKPREPLFQAGSEKHARIKVTSIPGMGSACRDLGVSSPVSFALSSKYIFVGKVLESSGGGTKTDVELRHLLYFFH